MYKLTTLPNKLKVISYNMPEAHGVTTGIFVATGSRFETDRLAGISHFIEHMLFKGTPQRPTPADISRAIEGIGGYTNAATSQDYTFFYNRVPSRHSSTAMEVLSDMLNNSLFNQDAIQRERGVILEELNMYLDTPIRYIYDLIMHTLWPSSSLGRDVIGTRQSIKSLKRPDFISYLHSHYQPSNMVIAAAGKINHNQLVAQAKQYFGHHKPKARPEFKAAPVSQARSQVRIYNKSTDQIHLALALPSLPRGHRSEATLAVLDAILGSGMSSRLFLNIREQQGLCYSINTFTEKFADAGIFGMTAGLNSARIDAAITAIISELKLISTEPVSSSELKKTKEYMRGSFSLQMDNTDNMAIWHGSQALFYPSIKTPQQKIKELLKVSQNDILKLAKQLFNSKRLNLALIGPFQAKDKARFSKLLTF